MTDTAASPPPDCAQPDPSGTGCLVLSAACTVLGTMGPDELRGTSGDDVICGFAGDDLLVGDAGDDELVGGEGDDVLTGGDGDDRLIGGAGTDCLYGGDGTDDIVDPEPGESLDAEDVPEGQPPAPTCAEPVGEVLADIYTTSASGGGAVVPMVSSGVTSFATATATAGPAVVVVRSAVTGRRTLFAVGLPQQALVRDGVAYLSVVCPRAVEGRIVVHPADASDGNRRLAHKAFSCSPPGQVVQVRLSALGRRLVARSGVLATHFTVTVDGRTVVLDVVLRRHA
jgi:hypothetical protein